MALAWKTVRVFISSTFRDMHAERDFLARSVFPEVQRRLAGHRVLLIDVDLRWGITEQDARAGLTVNVCLDEIDSCRPFFIGLLGQRYGTVPESAELSITAQEIYYALLQGCLPRQLSDLRPLLDTPPPNGCSVAERDGLLGCYPWNPDKRRYLLASELTEGQRSLLRGIFERAALFQRDRSFFFFRKPALTRRLQEQQQGKNFFESDPAIRRKLAALKRQIRRARLSVALYADLETLERAVTETLVRRLVSELGVQAPAADWLEQEDALHEQFMTHRTRHFAGRRQILDQLHIFLERTTAPGILLLSGITGCGKSALLAFLVGEIRNRHPDWLVLPHFVGASPVSTNLRETLRRLTAHLRRQAGSNGPAPTGLPALLSALPGLVHAAAKSRHVVIILDAVDQFDPWDNARSLSWLPQSFPPNVRVIVSALPDAIDVTLRQRAIRPETLELGGLTPVETRTFAETYLSEIRHELPNPRLAAAFYAKLGHGHPLYIRLALEELRLFGQFEKLGERVACLPRDAVGLFQQVIERIEKDFAAYPGLVRDFLALLACLRTPMTASALQVLLRHHAPLPAAGQPPAPRLPDLVWNRLYLAFRFYLFERSDLLDFFHRQLKTAVEQHYLSDVAGQRAVHTSVAGFCGRWEDAPDPQVRAYALRFLSFHLAQAHQWDRLAALLSQPFFLEACRQEGCTPAAGIAETVEAATAETRSELAAHLRQILRQTLRSPAESSKRVALEICAELEWLDVLAEAAEGDDEVQRVEACSALFAVYNRRLHRGEKERAWEVVQRLGQRARGRLGLPRRKALSALIGLFVTIFIESSENPDQISILIERVRETAWAVLPVRRSSSGVLRRLQFRAGVVLLNLFRPGVALGLAALKRLSSAVNLETAQRFFRQTPAQREILRGYFRYLEPLPLELDPLAQLMRRYCAERDAFHFNLITGAIASQGAAQPGPVIRLLREIAAQDDSLALYIATRGVYYILCYQRETGMPPSLDQEQLLVEWCVRYYRRPDYELDLHGARIPRRSLAEHVSDYLGHYLPAVVTGFDHFLMEVMLQTNTSLQRDLLDALGVAGQQGGHALVFRLLGPVLQMPHELAPPVRRMLVEALARIYRQQPQALSEWLRQLPGALVRLEEIAQYPAPRDSLWRGGNEQILRRILQREPAMRAVLHRMLDGLPRAPSVPAYLHYVGKVLLELLIEEKAPPNPYAVPLPMAH